MQTMTRRRRGANGEYDVHRQGERRETAGLIALAAGAVAAAAVLFLFTTRAGREARARLQDGDFRRRLEDTVEDIQRLAEHGAAYIERKAGELREAIGDRAGMLETRFPRGE